MSARKCTGTTKAGKPCKAVPLAPGTELEGIEVSGKFCRAHDPDLPASARFGSRAQASDAGKLGGRPAQPRAIDVIRERLEAELDEWLAPIRDALDAMEPYTVGFGKDAYVEMVPDHRTRLKAIEMVLDRSYGKPKQQTEITGGDGGPVELVQVKRDRKAEVAGLLARTVRPGGE